MKLNTVANLLFLGLCNKFSLKVSNLVGNDTLSFLGVYTRTKRS